MDADPETTESVASSPWRRTRVTLETGGWWEVLPDDMEHFMRHARSYVASKSENPEAQARVKAVWLNHEYRPAWQRRGPPPPPRSGKPKLVETASAVVDNATGEVVELVEDPF